MKPTVGILGGAASRNSTLTSGIASDNNNTLTNQVDVPEPHLVAQEGQAEDLDELVNGEPDASEEEEASEEEATPTMRLARIRAREIDEVVQAVHFQDRLDQQEQQGGSDTDSNEAGKELKKETKIKQRVKVRKNEFIY